MHLTIKYYNQCCLNYMYIYVHVFICNKCVYIHVYCTCTCMCIFVISVYMYMYIEHMMHDFIFNTFMYTLNTNMYTMFLVLIWYLTGTFTKRIWSSSTVSAQLREPFLSYRSSWPMVSTYWDTRVCSSL